MKKTDMMPVRANQATMWTLNPDRNTVRLAAPPLRLAALPEPLAVTWTSMLVGRSPQVAV